MEIRKISKNEYEELRSVWCDVFGDDALYVDELYYVTKATGYVLADNDKMHSFLTVIDVGSYKDRTVKMIYAVCTRPESRGQGYASKLVAYVRDEIDAGGALSLICPADSDLVSFYDKLGYKAAFYAKNSSAAANDIGLSLSILSEEEYSEYRKAFLADIPHIELCDSFTKFVKQDSHNSQGFVLINNGDAICTVNYGNDEEVGISEILVNPVLLSRSLEIADQLAEGLAALFDVKTCYYRTTAYSESYVQGMIYGCDVDAVSSEILPYFGHPLD